MWHYHYVTELNLIQRHLDVGDEVFIMECNESLLACECNKSHELHHCLRCIGIRQDGVAALEGTKKAILFDDSKRYTEEAKLFYQGLSSLSDLKQLKYEKFDVGSAVFSSLVDHSQNTNPSILEFRELIIKLIADAINSYRNFDAWLKLNKPDEVYIFNGRYAVARGLLRACEHNEVHFYTHERTGNLNKVQLFSGGFPHDPRFYPVMARKFWEQHSGDPEFLAEGAEFFEERPRGKLTGWQPFIGQQTPDLLPAGFDPTKRNVAVFGSSESEMLAIEGLMEGVQFPDQLKVYSAFFSLALQRCPELFFYLRLHPNSTTEGNRWWEEPMLVDLPNLSIIQPGSDISSYALLRECEKAVGLTTTMCLEATYWGKPSIVLGPTFYSGIDAVYEPRTLEEACDLVAEFGLPPKAKDNAIMYGAFSRCYGDQLQHSNPRNYYTLDFKGKILEARAEIHSWLGECEKRPPATGMRKWIQDRNDRRRYQAIWDQFEGWFAQTPKPRNSDELGKASP